MRAIPRRGGTAASAAAWLAAFCMLASAPTASAQVVVCSEPPPRDTEPGADGDGVSPGQPGADGASHLCAVETNAEIVFLYTQGANGGAGGWGGIAPPGADAPAGGSAGDGGDALSQLVLEHPGPERTFAEAQAHAGNGGYGGSGGEASDGGAMGANAPGADGGDAVADVTLRAPGSPDGARIEATAFGGFGGGGGTQVDAIGSGGAGGSATTRVDASSVGPLAVESAALAGIGADGGPAGGYGGDANLRVNARTEGDGHSIRIGLAQVPNVFRTGARGGDGGYSYTGSYPDLSHSGDGGDATSESIATALGDSLVSVEDRAEAGDSGGSGLSGEGGNASSRAVGSNRGAAPVTVSATAIAGSTRSVTGVGGDAKASAHGESLSGAVHVSAAVEGAERALAPGRDIALVDAVTGSTTGTLTLEQSADAGRGGYSSSLEALRGGDAFSSLAGENPGGGDLVVVSSATGGAGGLGGTATASALGRVSGDADVDVTAEASGGIGNFNCCSSIPPAGDGGEATIGIALAEALGSGDATARAHARGGTGGSAYGGDGGDGADAVLVDAVAGASKHRITLVQSARGGDGGDSGLGQAGSAGDAESRLFQGDPAAEVLELHALATGGAGGGGMTAPGRAPDGGEATAQIDSRRERGAVAAFALATGGEGGGLQPIVSNPSNSASDAGDGGAALVDVHVTTEGDGRAIAIGSATDANAFGAVGGRGATGGSIPRLDAIAGSGGNATSRSEAIALGASRVEVHDRAAGGNGGNVAATGGSGGAAGLASSTAIGSNAGADEVVVGAEATGGNAGSLAGTAPDGAGANATARGVSTGGGDVLVTAVATGGRGGIASGPAPLHHGNGGSIAATNAVSGSTASTLTLIQHAVGGETYDPGFYAARGGDASSMLEAENPGGGHLVLVSEALGGRSGRTVVGGSAVAGALGTTRAANLLIEARATGGQGGSSGSGGAATLGSVFGRSTEGGRVDVFGEAIGGAAAGTGGQSTGASVALRDAVDGETSGELILRQRVEGGRAATPAAINPATRAGDASSSLERERSAESLLVRSEAAGGASVADNRLPSFVEVPYAAAGNASAQVVARNPGGSAAAEALAVGGLGAGVVGGELRGVAVASALAETVGDGHYVRVGVDPLADASVWEIPEQLVLTTGAQGGIAADQHEGGAAQSRSVGVALGASRVDVVDVARGGGAQDAGRRGGAATSTAEGSAAGAEPVHVHSIALGGYSRPSRASELGGQARASSSARGAGAVVSRATAVSGSSSGIPVTGFPDPRRANAVALAEGGSGAAIAEVGQRVAGVFSGARAEASVLGSTTTEAAASVVEDVAAAVARDSFAGVTSRPSATLLATALEGDPFLAAQVATAGTQNALALGRWEAENTRSAAVGSILLRSQFDFTTPQSSTPANFFLGLLNPEVGASVPELLRVLVKRDGQVVVDEELRGRDAILDFFDDRAIELPGTLSGSAAIHVSLELEGAASPGEIFSTQVLLVRGTVPEPGTGVLLLVGLCALARLRRPPRRAPR